MTKIGIIGHGMIGQMHAKQLSQNPRVELVAIADKMPERLEAEGAVTGNLAEQTGSEALSVETYSEGDELLAKADVDAVFICLPTFLHKEYCLKAIEAGKHIFCEKPMTLTGDEGRELVQAVQGYEKVFMVGHCIRFWPAYAKGREIIEEGRYGKVRSAHFARIGGRPLWSWDNWLQDDKRSGGAMHDLHIHDVDTACFFFGKPDRINAAGVMHETAGPDYVCALYGYDDGKLVTIEGGWHNTAPFPFRMQYRVVFEEATLDFNASLDMKLHLYANGEDHLIDPGPGDGYTEEHAYFLDCVEQGKAPEITTPESSLQSVLLVEAERAAMTP
jgi:predicted dehydrogenase